MIRTHTNNRQAFAYLETQIAEATLDYDPANAPMNELGDLMKEAAEIKAQAGEVIGRTRGVAGFRHSLEALRGLKAWGSIDEEEEPLTMGETAGRGEQAAAEGGKIPD